MSPSLISFGAGVGCRCKSWLLPDQLVVVAGLVQGLLVGWHGCQEVLSGAGQPDEPPVHLERDVLQDVLRVVGQLVDIQQRGVGLHEWLVPARIEVEGDF